VTTSGTWSYGPLIAELFDEAVEIAGVDPSVTGGAHIKSAFRSLRLMVNSEWSTLGIRRWMVREAQAHTTAVGETFFQLPAGAIDIVEARLRRPGSGAPGASSEVEMYPITRQEYGLIANKTIQGRPDRYFVDRQAGINSLTGLSNVTVYYWQAGSNTTDQIVYDLFQQMQDVNGTFADTLDIPAYAMKALVHGWAAQLALKWNPAKFQMLDQLYRGPPQPDGKSPSGYLGQMLMEDRERGDIDMYPAYEPRTGRR
jgi:hypothetical protein